MSFDEDVEVRLADNVGSTTDPESRPVPTVIAIESSSAEHSFDSGFLLL